MKKKKLIWINAFILGFSVLVATSCIKQNDPSPNIPEEISPIVFNPNLTYGTVSDIDSNVYKTITIGTQTWMAQNLNTTHYQNGDSIINANTNAKWNIAGPAFVKYPYSKASNWDSIYGKLYNGYAVIDTRNICPTGWHVPTDAEWKILYNYLGGEAIAVGQKIQETGTTHWKTEYGISTGVTNESGFTALPGGTR